MNYIHSPFADVLGKLKAGAADIRNEIEGVNTILIGLAAQNPNACVFEGDLFRATVSFSMKKVVDYKLLVEILATRLGYDAAGIAGLLEEHTQRAEGVPVVRCTARKGA